MGWLGRPSSAMRPLLPAALATITLAACADTPTLDSHTAEVIGGVRTPDDKFPGVVGLLYDFGGGQLGLGCTGTLIARDVVLTAAHCLDAEVTGGITPSFVTFGHDTTGARPPTHAVSRVIKHPSFDINADIGGGLGQFFDIGLVFLAAPVTDHAPMRMPTPDLGTALAIDDELAIVGYGQTSDADPNSVGVMYDALTGVRELGPTELRVSSGGGDPQNCHGDSGGPAFATFDGEQRVVGVVSRSYQSPQCDNGGVDTRVDAYLTWIHETAADAAFPCGSGLAAACPVGDEDGGCCSTGTSAPGPLAVGAAVAALLARRRRR